MHEDLNDLTRRIIGLAMRVHTRLGPGLPEQAYKRCLGHEFSQAGIPYQAEVELKKRHTPLRELTRRCPRRQPRRPPSTTRS